MKKKIMSNITSTREKDKKKMKKTKVYLACVRIASLDYFNLCAKEVAHCSTSIKKKHQTRFELM